MPPKKDNYTWAREHISALVDLGSACCSIEKDIANSFEYWTPLKLCALKNYVDIYTRILDDTRLRRLHFSGRTYLDIFAGSGINLIGPNRIPLAGSSLLATKFHFKNNSFDRYIAVEMNQKYAHALEKRMKYLVGHEKPLIICDDANQALPKVIEQIEESKHHYMAFIDYEGAKGFSWESMELLLEHKGDLWITFCINLARTLGRSVWSEEDRKTLCRMVGEDVVEISTNQKELIDNYINKIQRYREYIVPIRVTSGFGYQYLLIFATRQTQGGTRYISAVESLRNRIEGISGSFIQTVMEILEGKTRDITLY